MAGAQAAQIRSREAKRECRVFSVQMLFEELQGQGKKTDDRAVGSEDIERMASQIVQQPADREPADDRRSHKSDGKARKEGAKPGQLEHA